MEGTGRMTGEEGNSGIRRERYNEKKVAWMTKRKRM